MPITGHPDPARHRMCKRCGTWCHLHEGALTWPPRRGLLSFVHVALAESVARESELKFYCQPCQERNARDERAFRKVMLSMVWTVVVLVVFVPLASWLGVFAWLQTTLRSH